VKKKPSPLDMGLHGFLTLDILANRIIELGQRVEALQIALQEERDVRASFAMSTMEAVRKIGSPSSIASLECYKWSGVIRQEIYNFTHRGFWSRLAWLLIGT
jgi:hypothetical protein